MTQLIASRVTCRSNQLCCLAREKTIRGVGELTVIGEFRRIIASVDPAQLGAEDRIALIDLLRGSYEAEADTPPARSAFAAS